MLARDVYQPPTLRGNTRDWRPGTSRRCLRARRPCCITHHGARGQSDRGAQADHGGFCFARGVASSVCLAGDFGFAVSQRLAGYRRQSGCLCLPGGSRRFRRDQLASGTFPARHREAGLQPEHHSASVPDRTG